MNWTKLIMITFLWALIVIPTKSVFCADADLIPPEILKAMDPEILAGKRPVIAFIRQNEIFGLRSNPKLKADFVRLDFNPAKLSSTQKDIIRNWAESGVNQLLLIQDDILKYTSIISNSSAHKNLQSGYKDNVKKANAITAKLLRHPVNTDCKDLGFWFGDRRGGSGGGEAGISGLPQEVSIIVESNAGVPLSGVFPIGKGKVFFFSPPVGTDSRRWELNFWHWAFGLSVPGSAEVSTASASSLSLDEAARYDTISLKNGDVISGTILNKHFTIQTSYSELKFDRANIEKIVLEGNGANSDSLLLRVGDKLSGLIKEQMVQIKLLAGQTAQVDKDKIMSIQMRKVEIE